MVMSNLTTIHERTGSLSGRRESTPDNPVVPGVKVLGVDSKNGRKYPVDVMKKALEKYEGAIVNIDHPAGSEPRSYEDRFGRLTNARLESDGIYADLAYNPKHPLAEGFKWWVANDPKAIGLSHNAQAKTKLNQEGVEEIEEIVTVESVDLVAEPATTAGLLECVIKSQSRIESVSTKGSRSMNVREGRKIADTEIEENWIDKLEDLNEKIGNLADQINRVGGIFGISVGADFYTDLKSVAKEFDKACENFGRFLQKTWTGAYARKKKKESTKSKKLNAMEAKKRKSIKRILVAEAIKDILKVRKGV